MVKSPSNRDMQNILKALYPNLEALVERILGATCYIFLTSLSLSLCPLLSIF